jgi:hypothetical protein
LIKISAGARTTLPLIDPQAWLAFFLPRIKRSFRARYLLVSSTNCSSGSLSFTA